MKNDDFVYEGIGKKCFVCQKIITELDVEKNNRPMKMMSIPGFVHRKCKIESDSFVVGTSFNSKDLTKEVNDLWKMI